MNNQEEKKTEKTDETKDTTTEATSKDKADALVEKTLAEEEERKRQTRSKIKIALIAMGLSLLSIVCLYLIAYNNVITNFNDIACIILGSIIGGILGGMIGVMIFNAGAVGSIFSGGVIGSVIGGILGGTNGAITGFIIGGIFSVITDCIIRNTMHDIKKEIHPELIALLSIVFLLPFVTILVPLSKYHNQNQIKRDTIISEAHLQIKILEDEIEILLPSEYDSDNSYLEKTLFVNYSWDMVEEKAWKDIVIPCREGNKYWYKIKLPSPEKKTNTVDLFLVFKHVWENYETTKKISFPDPNE